MYDCGMDTAVNNQSPAAEPRTPCCLNNELIGADKANQLSRTLKALADPMRLRLLSHIGARGCSAVCACDLTTELGITQPTVSYHMKKLVDAGLITREQRGKWAHYSVVPEAFAQLRGFLHFS